MEIGELLCGRKLEGEKKAHKWGVVVDVLKSGNKSSEEGAEGAARHV